MDVYFGKVVGTGSIGSDYFSVEWRLPKFLSLSFANGEWYESPLFRTRDEGWSLRLYQNDAVGGQESDWLELDLNTPEGETFYCCVGIRGSEGVEMERDGENNLLYFGGYAWLDFCLRSDLRKQRRRLLPDGTLNITCFVKRIDAAKATGPAAPDDSVHLQRLSDDFSRLLSEGIEPDATLTCGGRTWKVHRSILSVRSDVFAATFRSGMTESQTGSVRVEDLEASVLDSVLEYVYRGKVPEMTVENVSGLYEAGDRYALHELRKACSDWMAGSLSDENCLSFLVTADAHGDADLKEASAAFVAKHFSQMESAVWTNFVKEHSDLGIEVLQRFAPPLKK